MILQELRLRNFGLYRGEQVLNLAPVSATGKKAPIILFGGLNGGGKTTILDAVQLALYGQRAQCAKRAGRPYDAFLADSIHHGSPIEEGASVALRFVYAGDEGPHEFEMIRAWSLRDGKTRESLVIHRNQEIDPWMSDNWNQVVEDLIPLGLSQLFFFDAEKIRFLAEDETTSSTLGTAIKSLLGLDLAERLIADTTILESRLARSSTPNEPVGQLDQEEAELATLVSKLREAKSERAALENELLRAEREMQNSEEDFANVGGKHWNQREQRKSELKSLQDQQELHVSSLRNAAATELPMAIVLPALKQIAETTKQESQTRSAELIRQAMTERDSRLIQMLKTDNCNTQLLAHIRQWLRSDLVKLSRKSEAPVYAFSDEAEMLLHHVTVSLGDQTTECTKVLETVRGLNRDMDVLERSLATASNDAQLKPVLERVKTTTRHHAEVSSQAAGIDRMIAELHNEIAVKEQRLNKIRRARIDSDIENEQSQRMRALVDRTRDTMRLFLEKSTLRKIERLAGLVTESFRFLLRKKSLVERIEIDPRTFRISMIEKNGILIPKERLSEGEKQIFAIAVLWGLGRASTRPLPTIIDTPMGRLDSVHRDYLIDRYFPNASHQVIILSTDTEVDQEFYQRLSPAVARSYHLDYCEPERFTTAKEGYFWAPRSESESAAGVVS